MSSARSFEIASACVRAIRRALLGWYDANARDLPWRRTSEPYRIWLSEIMLQQTRVEAVIPYYRRFLEAFPDVTALAAAPLQRVLKLWEGLGYYSRARNLHAAAKVVAGELGGRFPRSAEGLRKLPGVGRYSAGAISSIAFGAREPVLDGNVKRVLARLIALAESIDEARSASGLWDLAGLLVPNRRPGDFNQAMMELGATVCLPRRPRCGACPLAGHCEAAKRGLAEQLPVRKAKQARPHYQIVAAAVEKRGWFLIGQRPEGGLLGGLWELPGGKVEPGETHAQALRRELREECGVAIEVGERIAAVDHAYSHFSITLWVYRCRVASGRPEAIQHEKLKWVPRAKLGDYPWPKANLKVLPLL